MPLCTMAFYSYVMMKNVRVGIEAILHVVREQHDRGMTEVRASLLPALLLMETNKWLDECNCLLNVSL